MTPYDKQGRYYPPIKRQIRYDVYAALAGCAGAMIAGGMVILLGYLFGRSCGMP